MYCRPIIFISLQVLFHTNFHSIYHNHRAKYRAVKAIMGTESHVKVSPCRIPISKKHVWTHSAKLEELGSNLAEVVPKVTWRPAGGATPDKMLRAQVALADDHSSTGEPVPQAVCVRSVLQSEPQMQPSSTNYQIIALQTQIYPYFAPDVSNGIKIGC